MCHQSLLANGHIHLPKKCSIAFILKTFTDTQKLQWVLRMKVPLHRMSVNYFCACGADKTVLTSKRSLRLEEIAWGASTHKLRCSSENTATIAGTRVGGGASGECCGCATIIPILWLLPAINSSLHCKGVEPKALFVLEIPRHKLSHPA